MPDRRRQAVAVTGRVGEHPAHVVAKGYGDLADQVIAEARRHGIYVHESPELVGLLMTLDFDERIPDRLYAVIAELLAWIGELDTAAAATAAAAPAGDVDSA